MLSPSQTVIATWTTAQDAVAWAGTTEELWTQAAAALGDPNLNNLLVLAGVADDDFRTAISSINPPVNPLRKSTWNLAFNTVKVKMSQAGDATFVYIGSCPYNASRRPRSTGTAAQVA